MKLVILVIFLPTCVFAAPPPNADMSLAPWYQNLRVPETQASCCSISDCRPVDWRTNATGYEAWIEGRWMPVPHHAILPQHDNPTGRAVACYTKTRGIICFVRGPET